MIHRLISHEVRQFQALSLAAQNVLRSFAVYEFLYPLLFIFVNAFILRQTQDFAAVAFYNLGMFLALPFSFYLNGYLLRRWKIVVPYTVGLVGQGVVACMVFFYPFTSLTSLFYFGALQGIPMGLFWANRNFITLDITHDENRGYFTGLEIVLVTLAGIITPVLVGWTIKLGDVVHFYTVDQAYKILGVLSLGVLLLGGKFLAGVQLDQPKFKKLFVGWGSTTWNISRLLEVFRGLQNSLDVFIGPLIIFTFLGREGYLGTVQSLAAAIEILIMYGMAKYLVPNRRLRTVLISIILLIGLSFQFALGFSALAALIYILFVRTISHTNWVASHPITMKVIDQEDGGDPTNNYAYVCDVELFLNIGRVIGVGIFFLLIQSFNPGTALRFIPLIAAAMQLGLYFCAKQLVQRSQ